MGSFCRTRHGLRPGLAALAAGLAGVVLLGACHRDNEAVLDVAVVGAPVDLAARGARLAPAGQLVQAATAQGLVALDAQGQVVPALADRWIVTDDGDSYIFRLRDGTWPDGTPLTAQGVARALREAFAALRGAPLGLELGDVDEVRVMTDRVLELRLRRPVPELLQVLAQPELGLRRRGRGSGPLDLVRPADARNAPAETPAGASGEVRLAEIPAARLGLVADDEPAPPSRQVRLRVSSADVATAAFARGDVAVVLGGRFQDLPLAQAAAGLSRRALQIDPAPGLFGLAVVEGGGPLAWPEFREALAMAIDRDALASAIGLAGWASTMTIVPPGAGSAAPADQGTSPGAEPRAAAPAWSAVALETRRAEALARVARARARLGGRLPVLRLGWPQGPGADAVLARLTADFAAIGVTLARVPLEAPAELRLVDAVARYPGTMWYLNQLSCPARRVVCSPALDARLAIARAERDSDRRAALLAAVEAEFAAAGSFLPLGTPVRWSLARPGMPGFALNPAAFHPLPPLADPPE